jgi:hypothetical protein
MPILARVCVEPGFVCLTSHRHGVSGDAHPYVFDGGDGAIATLIVAERAPLDVDPVPGALVWVAHGFHSLR